MRFLGVVVTFGLACDALVRPSLVWVQVRLYQGVATIASAEDALQPFQYIQELPEDQRGGALHISSLLREAAYLVSSFREALDLFDHALKRRNAISGVSVALGDQRRTDLRMSRIVRMQRWQTIAARDGAMTIWHFFMNLKAIDKILHLQCPDLLAALPQVRLKLIANLRKTHFKDYADVRHAVGHKAELRGTREIQRKNALDGWIMFSDQILDRTFYTCIGGRVVHYDVSEGTLCLLRQILNELYAAFSEGGLSLKQGRPTPSDPLGK